jgi:glycine cleavage system pyridoxal-binding protein P
MTTQQFARRHIGLQPEDLEKVLPVLGVETVDELIDEAVPDRILERRPLDSPRRCVRRRSSTSCAGTPPATGWSRR